MTTANHTGPERDIIRLTLRKLGALAIALYLQDKYSEPTWTEKAVKAEQARLAEMFR
jgi:hypothetical protein